MPTDQSASLNEAANHARSPEFTVHGESMGPRYAYADKAADVIGALCAACLGAIIFLACAEAVARYLFNNPPTWVGSVTLWINGWLVFLGSVAHFYRRSHLGFTEGLSYLKAPVRLAVETFGSFISVCTILCLCILSWRLVKLSFGNIDLASGAPRWIFYLSLAVGLTGMAGVVVWQLVDSLAKFRGGRNV